MNKIYMVLFLLLQSVINAQTNGLQLKGELGVRGKWQTGNFAQFVINPNGQLIIEQKRTRFEVQANYEFLKVNQGSLINDFWSYGLYQYNFGKTFFPMAITHYGFAQAYAIDRSLIGGGGVGINIINKNEFNYLQANLFAGYLNLKYENTAVHEATGLGSYVKVKFPLKNDLLYCILDSHAYMSLRNSDYHSFNSRIILVFQVVKRFGVNMTYRLVYNNNNPSVIEKTNGKLVFGLNYTFN